MWYDFDYKVDVGGMMSNKPLVLELPEELIERAEAAHIDLRQALIQTIERELSSLQHQDGSWTVRRVPTPEAIEAQIQKSLDKMAAGASGSRVLGLHAGKTWISDDFNDELPDEEWGDLFK
jgi:hypothetical protein